METERIPMAFQLGLLQNLNYYVILMIQRLAAEEAEKMKLEGKPLEIRKLQMDPAKKGEWRNSAAADQNGDLDVNVMLMQADDGYIAYVGLESEKWEPVYITECETVLHLWGAWRSAQNMRRKDDAAA